MCTWWKMPWYYCKYYNYYRIHVRMSLLSWRLKIIGKLFDVRKNVTIKSCMVSTRTYNVLIYFLLPCFSCEVLGSASVFLIGNCKNITQSNIIVVLALVKAILYVFIIRRTFNCVICQRIERLVSTRDRNFEEHVQFCEWFLHQMQNFNATLVQTVLRTDKVTFTNCGSVNTKNMHYWVTKNSQVNHQCRRDLNDWCGIIGHQIIGPYFIKRSVTGRTYYIRVWNTVRSIRKYTMFNTSNNMVST